MDETVPESVTSNQMLRLRLGAKEESILITRSQGLFEDEVYFGFAFEFELGTEEEDLL